MPLPEADSFLQTLPGFPTLRASQQTGAWFPLHSMVLGLRRVAGAPHRGLQGSGTPPGISRAVSGREAARLPRHRLCHRACRRPRCLEERSTGWEIPAPASLWDPNRRGFPRCEGAGEGVEEGCSSPMWGGDCAAHLGAWSRNDSQGDPSCAVCSWDRCCRMMKLQCWFQCLQRGGDPPG